MMTYNQNIPFPLTPTLSRSVPPSVESIGVTDRIVKRNWAGTVVKAKHVEGETGGFFVSNSWEDQLGQQ